MDINDYSGWTPRRPRAGFASRTVDAMLAASGEVSGEIAVAQIHRLPTAGRKTKKSRFGAIALLLAAALVATTAVGMYRAQRMSLPVVQTRLPTFAPPTQKPLPPLFASESAAVEQPAADVVEPPTLRRPKRVAAPKTPAPEQTAVPRCDCDGDVMVCGCIEP